MALTTPALITFLQTSEEFRRLVYDDLQPHVELKPGDEIKGTLTYGYGSTARPDGSPLQIGDEISHSAALDLLTKYVREEIEPTIENLIHVPITGVQADAIGSLIYNFGAPAVSGWRLIHRINSGDEPINIALEWLTDTYSSKGELLLGLYRRRIMEVLMFFGLDWRAGASITFENSVTEVLDMMGWNGKMPKLEPVPFDDPELEIPTRGADPKPAPPAWNDLTPDQQTAWLNGDQTMQLEKANETVQRTAPVGPAPAPPRKPIPLEEVKYGIHDPADVGYKPMKVTKRYKGAKNADNGKEMAAVAGTLGGAAAMAGSAKEITGYFETYEIKTILITVFAVSMIGLAIGAARWWHGRNQEWKGREDASQPMV